MIFLNKGVIKKIDELGRVVIPKDIRNNLKLKTGDILNINVDNETIKLQKYSDPEDYKKDLQRIVDIFKDTFNLNIVIIDREKVIASSFESTSNLNKEVIAKVENGEYYYSNDKDNYFLGLGYYYIEPIITSLSSVGALILFSHNEINEIYRNVLKFLSKYLKNIFDISC